MDEMEIKSGTEFVYSSKKVYGYTNFGNEVDENEEPEVAKRTLFYMLNALNGNFKLPIGYALVNKLNGVIKAALLKQLLLELQSVEVFVSVVVFDGDPANITMAETLGANFSVGRFNNNKFVSTVSITDVIEPVTFMLDVVHMQKLVRNNFASREIFNLSQPLNNIFSSESLESLLRSHYTDELINDDCVAEKRRIKWNHIESLHDLQEIAGVRLANKLTKQHVNFKNNKMKVRLAVQVLSDSVANAILHCDKTLEMKPFENSQYTVIFLKVFDRIFDIFNSKYLTGANYKKPLSHEMFET